MSSKSLDQTPHVLAIQSIVFLAPEWVHDVIRCILMQKIFIISGNVIAAKCMLYRSLVHGL